MRPQKAQVKDKGLGAKSWDLSGAFLIFLRLSHLFKENLALAI
jgi:hypothetical protein